MTREELADDLGHEDCELCDEARVGDSERRLAAALALLREVEWAAGISGAVLDYAGVCPFCVSTQAVGHAKDCRLAALLKEAEKGPKTALIEHFPKMEDALWADPEEKE